MITIDHPFCFSLTAVAMSLMLGRVPVRADLPIDLDDAQVVLIDNVTVAAPIAGTVLECAVLEGDPVEPGQRLLQLDSRRANAERNAAMAAHQAAEIAAKNDVNSRYAQRTQQVHQREFQQSQLANRQFADSVTATEMERLQLVVDQAELSMEQSRLDQETAIASANEKQSLLELAELRLKEHQIDAPIGGRIAERMVQNGDWVQAGGPLFRIISLNPIRVSGFIDGNQIDRSLMTFPAKFQWTDRRHDPPIEHQRTGQVTFISDELHPITGEVRVWVELSNADEVLRPGMKGRLTIERPAQNQ